MGSTTLHLDDEAKSRFDSLKRRMQASEDVDLNNSEALGRLIEVYESENLEAQPAN